MIILEGEESETLLAEFEKHTARFYALIGHCVTRHQFVEDYLPDVFGAALAGAPQRASALFAVVWGLERKLDMISAALTGAAGATVVRWDSLRKRVEDAADARNEIAHARPVHNGGMVGVYQARDNSPGKAIWPAPGLDDTRLS
jgi:hypothetical protein